MLLRVWADERLDGIAVAFDLDHTFSDYRARQGQREKMPNELVPQIDRIVQLVLSFGIPAVTADGYEPDDVLGTEGSRRTHSLMCYDSPLRTEGQDRPHGVSTA